MRVSILIISFLIFLSFTVNKANSSELIFQFTNPSFGGNPLNGSFLLQQAQLQNKFKEKTEERSLLEQFEPMYQAQYLSKILDDAYENNGQNLVDGTYVIGGLTVTVTKDDVKGMITLLVSDPTTGRQTTFQIPYTP